MKIFISYSRVDRPLTRHLVDQLREGYGYESIWFDEDLHGGDIWWDKILNQIAISDIFMYLLSNDSVQSPYCQAEFTEARRLQKLIITVQIRGRTHLPPELEDIQYEDMAGVLDEAKALNRLYRAIHAQQERIPQRRPKPLTPTLTSRPKMPTQEEEIAKASADDAPSLILPVPMMPTAKPKRDTAIIGAIIGGVFVIIAAIIGIMPSLLNHSSGTTVTTTAPLIALVSASALPSTSAQILTFTPSNTASLIPTATPSATDISATDVENTVRAVMNFSLTDNAKTSTAIASNVQQTAVAVTKDTIESLTQTATFWTHTPTPNIRGTANARLTATQAIAFQTATANSQASVTQVSLNETATATMWTATPTPTFTPIPPTKTFTFTPIPPTATYTFTPIPPSATYTVTSISTTDVINTMSVVGTNTSAAFATHTQDAVVAAKSATDSQMKTDTLLTATAKAILTTTEMAHVVTSQALLTQISLNKTATATLWTATPTPTFTATKTPIPPTASFTNTPIILTATPTTISLIGVQPNCDSQNTLLVEGNNLFVMDGEGKQKTLITNALAHSFLDDRGPQLSPDGKKTVFTTTGDHLAIANSDGSNLQKLTNDGSAIDSPIWSLDGKYIFFTAHANGTASIDRIAIDTKQRVRLTSTSLYAYQAWLSPDGKLLAFKVNSQTAIDLFVMDLDGNNLRRLTTNNTFNRKGPFLPPIPVWSPDNKHIAFTSNRNGGNSSDLYIVDADGQNLRRLTKNINIVAIIQALPTAWSPDGQWILAESYDNNIQSLGIYNLNGADSKIIDVDTTFNSGPSWSSDSKYIAFVYTTNNYQTQIVSIAGTDKYIVDNSCPTIKWK